MSGLKLNLESIIAKEMLSLEEQKVKHMYDMLYGVTGDEVVRSPYEIDRDKTIFRTRQQIVLQPRSNDKGKYTYMLVEKKTRHVMDLASKMFIHDTIPAIKVKEEFRGNTEICHCSYPGHVRIEAASLYHGSELAGTLDNITLDEYAQFNIPNDKRDFYRRMVGDIPEHTTWNTELPSFQVSVPQPWYFCIIPGAELRLNCKTETHVDYSFREDPIATLRMRIREDGNEPWKEVDPADYMDRIVITPLNRKNSGVEVCLITHKCHEEYSKQLENSNITIPCEDVINMDIETDSDRNTHEINIDAHDFVRRICVLAEHKDLVHKSIYYPAIKSGSLSYDGTQKKIPDLTPLRMLYDDAWSSSVALPDRNGFYMLTFSDHNRVGAYDASMSLGGISTKLTLILDRSNTYILRVRLHVYRIVVYENNTVRVIDALNASRFILSK